jgi:hypothetical protein
MKTLKQIIEEKTFFVRIDNYPFINYKKEVIGKEDIINIIKEWLTQKRQNFLKNGEYAHKFICLEQTIIDELLEELINAFI